MTKKVLMICYYFPPIVASGVARSLEFAKLLPHSGWEPLVLTVRHPRIPGSRLTLGGIQQGSGWSVVSNGAWRALLISFMVHAVVSLGYSERTLKSIYSGSISAFRI